jgi:hypothetical protein
MFRFGALFLLLFGLVLGLWIGFNPELRSEAVQSVNHANRCSRTPRSSSRTGSTA